MLIQGKLSVALNLSADIRVLSMAVDVDFALEDFY
jgi:hypothetical protein